MLKVGIILGSTRPGRSGEAVARWVHEQAVKRGDAEYELLDLRDYALPNLDEKQSAALNQYEHPHTKKWSAAIAPLDAFVFVTPEYNHSTSGALKNAIDFLFHEWSNKAAGFVGYGADGAVRAVEHLRQILGMLSVADVAPQVVLSLFHDFENLTEFKPAERQQESLKLLLDQLLTWAAALRTIRV